jgi:membrane protease YdiL (CAAX protease family)
LAAFDITKHQPQYFISTLIFQLIFTGVCEEIYFRGYIQSRLNEDFNHPYILKNLKFGPGVTIAALLFGLAHVFNPFYLIIGHFKFNIFSGIFAAQFGMLIGIIREKTNSILIPILIHGLYNGFVSFFSGLPDLFQTLIIGFGFMIAWIFLFTIFIKKYKIKELNIKEINNDNSIESNI